MLNVLPEFTCYPSGVIIPVLVKACKESGAREEDSGGRLSEWHGFFRFQGEQFCVFGQGFLRLTRVELEILGRFWTCFFSGHGDCGSHPLGRGIPFFEAMSSRLTTEYEALCSYYELCPG